MTAIYVWERIGRCLSRGKCEKKMGMMENVNIGIFEIGN